MMLEDLRARLWQAPPQLAHHIDYSGEEAQAAPVKASVLLPIVTRDAPHLLFTRRTTTLARHSGQVSFPGGRSEPHDLTPVETALRETFEETGIDPAHVTVAGYLDRYITGTGFDIQPVVGLVADGFTLTPDPREVEQVFEVPLAFLLDPANRRRETAEFGGRQRSFYVFSHDGHRIWGATAAIIVDLAERLNAISPP